MIEDKLHDLPEGWIRVRLGDIFHLHYGKGLTKKQRIHSGDVPVYGSSGLLGYHDTPYTKKPCLIVGRKGNVGSVFLSDEPCWPIDTTYYIEIPSSMHIAFSYYLLSQKQLLMLDKSTAIPGINRNDMYALTIPLPPITEQYRIVDKIDELFTNLDAGIESLKKVQAQVKRYRQAVLKHAFEGKLTAAWREENKKTIEHATLTEQFWGKYDGKGEKAHIDLLGISDLQKEWGVLRLEHIVRERRIGLVRSLNEQSGNAEYGYGYIKMNNVTMDGKILFNDVVYVKATKKELELYSLKNDDILFNTRNSHELVGKVGMVKGLENENMVFNNNLMRIRTVSSISPQFLLHQMCSPKFRNKMEKVKRSTTNVSALYAKDIMPLPIIICTFEEQQEIVEEIERRFSIADRVEEIVDQNLKRAERLRQSILKKAFEGKLVPQDPSDEPASVLLERIRSEKEKSDNQKPAAKGAKTNVK